MKSVFISSTKMDLKEYREAASEVCSRLELTPIGMEHFEPEEAIGAEISKRQLEKADLYVAIVAHLYGEVTEVEYDHAGVRGIERLCFVVDDSYSWPVDSIDFKNKDRLDAFKGKIEQEVTSTKFTSVKNLKLLLTQALASWKESNHLEASPNTADTPPASFSIKPPRPVLLLGRQQDLSRLKVRLGIPFPDSLHTLTIVRGWPGVGKTTLINSLVYDEEVNKHFSDGILWAVLGEEGNAFSRLAEWGRQLGIHDISAMSKLEEVIARLRKILETKKMLLIVDDAWGVGDAIPFKAITGPNSALLISTRFPGVAISLSTVPDKDIYLLEVLDDDKAFELLDQLAPDITGTYPVETRELVQALEGLPLALRVAGRLLAEEKQTHLDVRPLMKEIVDSHKLLEASVPDDRIDPVAGTTPTISLLLRRSTDRLNPQTREYFSVLGAFAPKPATFDMAALQFMWGVENVEQATEVVRRLVLRGLLEPIPAVNRYQMHAVLVKLAQSLLEQSNTGK